MKNLYLLLITLMTFIACGEAPQENQDASEMPEKNEVVQEKYTLTPFDPSPGYEDAEILDMQFKDGKFNFDIGGESYKLGEQTPDAPQKMCANSAKGQHIHLIVDDQPYAAKYNDEFDYEIEDGDHYLLAFLSRSYHESIKTDKASVAIKATIEGNSINDPENISEPMLFYSRPKGTYVGEDTKKVMLDFYLVNADLGNDYKVMADINGEEHMLDKWQPYYIEGLPMGKNTITLSLVDASGNLVETPLNPVSRTIELVADPAENQ